MKSANQSPVAPEPISGSEPLTLLTDSILEGSVADFRQARSFLAQRLRMASRQPILKKD
jgi:hypothetical protein